MHIEEIYTVVLFYLLIPCNISHNYYDYVSLLEFMRVCVHVYLMCAFKLSEIKYETTCVRTHTMQSSVYVYWNAWVFL